MTIRIPRPVDLAWDWVGRNPDVLIPAVILPAAALVAFVNPWAAVIVGLLGWVVFELVAHRVGMVARLRARVRDLEYDLAAAMAENRRLRQGDPTARTIGLLPIRDNHTSPCGDGRWSA